MGKLRYSKCIVYVLLLMVCVLLCQCSNNNQSKGNDRSDYVQRAREQDSLRIAHYQDSVEKARLATIAQKEKEEAERVKAEQERKKQEEAKRAEERRIAEETAKRAADEKAKYEAEQKRIAEENARLEAERKRKAEEKLKKSGEVNGYGYVDLGLSVKWATNNIGASSYYEKGDFIAWGEIKTKVHFDIVNYKYGDGSGHIHSPRIGSNISGTGYDAAKHNWGTPWRLPTKDELYELKNKCVWERKLINGQYGYEITGPSGKSIFLPIAGCYSGDELSKDKAYYWSGTLNHRYSFNAECLIVEYPEYSEKITISIDDYTCSYGMLIRPVVDK